MTAATIGGRIHEERERLGQTQGSFAAMAGASKRVQAKWEKGQSCPTAPVLAAWHVAGLDVLYIVTGRRDPLIGAEPAATPPVPPTIAAALASIAAQVAPARAHLVIEPADEAGA